MNVVGHIAVAAAAIVFLGPLIGLLVHVEPATLRELTSGESFKRALTTTVVTGALSAALSVVIGFFLARQFALHDWRGKRAQRLMALLPYLVPNFILASAYIVAWNPTTGLMTSWLPLPGSLYGSVGIIWILAVAHAPIALLLSESKLTRIDASWREAALLAGAGTRTLLRRIELPLLLPTLLGAFGLCFALNISAFAIPAWIGAPERVYTLTYKIYQVIQVGGADGIPDAAVYALVLMALVVPVLGLGAWQQRGERRHALVTGKAARRTGRAQSTSRQAVFQSLFWLYQILSFVAPMVCLTLTTLAPPGCWQDRGLACIDELTTRAYHYVLFDLAEAHIGFQGSAVYGTLSAALVLAVALAAVMAVGRTARLRRAIEAIFVTLIATPGAVIALGLIVTCSGAYGVNLYNTPWIVVLAMLLKHQNLAFQPLVTGLSGIAPALTEAARLAGASPATTWRRIVLPILKPELFGGFFLVLIPILGELTMSIFLASPSFRSLGTVLFDLQDYADHASAGALSIILVAVILLSNELARLLTRGKLGY
jgi:iron(III) transport system permease protein